MPKLIPIITYAVTLFVSLTESRLRTETIIGHREILEAVRDKDSRRAEQAMAQHIEYNRALLEEIIRKLKKEQAESSGISL